ncbi:phosphoglycolate phosphatase, putative [Heliomicrobium modesticaldum Ice1]|uniref:Phosphoglycolate phosphatase, putative n=1 Tax=Heliobacterium modesticaldum (strain ATCC 51547 / Ice1) TaxID=498761 RepID=B0TDE2_HELMI|nr:HAD family hydrolase [Heliomicrobium modesticaldum]ABZ84183.1 phosphoglycolate phosphatase, putative [Heliomicrobium modesticaldum Ice1]
MACKAVIFDLDGTLLDTLADLADSMNRVLSRAGFPAHSLDEYRYFVGDGLATMVRRALPEAGCDEETLRRCFTDMQEEYGRNWAVKTAPYTGVMEMLEGLAARNISMAVLSNKPHDWTVEMTDYFFPQRPFAMVFGQRPSVPKKPDPAGALEIAARFAFAPADILYLGDTNTDMKTARGAGMPAIGVLWGFRPAEELLASGADRLIGHPSELFNLIDEG